MNPQAEQNWKDDEPMEPQLRVEDGSSSPNQPSTPQPPPKKRRPRGKIARLRKEDRDLVNTMLRDGVEYGEILTKLGEAGKGIVPRNVGNWHNGDGYERWEKDQAWLEDMRADQEPGLDLLPNFD